MKGKNIISEEIEWKNIYLVLFKSSKNIIWNFFARILCPSPVKCINTMLLFGPFPSSNANLKASAISSKATVPEPSSSAPLWILSFTSPM